jgi:5'-nucleotidase (lipoprotein e(P4) family)
MPASKPVSHSMRAHTWYVAVLLAGVSLSLSAQASPPVVAREGLYATAWMQRAVEFRANALQTYRAATARLAQVKTDGQTASVEQQRKGGFKSKKPAVVLDIDETVLDNSPAQAALIAQGQSFGDGSAFERWVQAAQAQALPGAKAFITEARARGFRVVFISNRNCAKDTAFDANGRALNCPQKPATLKNLSQALGYTVAEADLMLRGEVQGRDDGDKVARRTELAKKNRIALLLGDDLNDFIRRSEYDPEVHATQWGDRWFALPNAMYGSWVSTLGKLDQVYAALQPWSDADPAPVPTPVPTPTPSSGITQLNLVSWNLEWMSDADTLVSAQYWEECTRLSFPNTKPFGREDLPFCDVYSKKGITTDAQYRSTKLAPMRARLLELAAEGMDVLSTQEVQSPSALAQVLPAGFEVLCATTRPDPQNLVVAVRQAWAQGLSCEEVHSLSREGTPGVSRPVRRGLAVSLPVKGKTVQLLDVHLKSSCPTGPLDTSSNPNCGTLRRQVEPLEAWIEAQAEAGRPFLIAGDWNRDLEAEANGHLPARGDGSDPQGPIQQAVVRSIWPEINDMAPPTSAMALVQMDRSAAAGKACHDILDQMAVSITLRGMLAPASLQGGELPAAFLSRPKTASDHCPVRTRLVF